MKKIFRSSLFQALCFSLLITTVYSCSDDDNTVIVPVGPEANSISGTITFEDTNFVTSGGYYDISAFTSWFPSGPPTGNDSLIITKVGNKYQANYKISNLPNGQYFLSSAWIKLPYVQFSVNGLGTYGCDTSSAFTCRPDSVTISNNVGVENINFLSWADTTNRIYQY